MHFEVAFKSDPGVLRSLNEDCVFADAERGVLVLGDGMGGHKSGELASAIAVSALAKALCDPRLRGRSAKDLEKFIGKAVRHAGRLVYSESAKRASTPGFHPNQTMGTTIALMMLHNESATIAHVGDSRVYRLRDGRLTLLTRDHSLLQEQLDQGIMSPSLAVDSHNRHYVTRGLGVSESVDVSVIAEQPSEGDIYLICSDGLNDMLSDDEIELVLNAVGVNLELAAEQLVMIANDTGGEDNVSVILSRVLPGSVAEARRGMFAWIAERLPFLRRSTPRLTKTGSPSWQS